MTARHGADAAAAVRHLRVELDDVDGPVGRRLIADLDDAIARLDGVDALDVDPVQAALDTLAGAALLRLGTLDDPTDGPNPTDTPPPPPHPSDVPDGTSPLDDDPS